MANLISRQAVKSGTTRYPNGHLCVVAAWDTTEVGGVPLAPAPISGLIPEENDVIVARGTAAADTGGVGVVDSLGPL